MFKFRKCKYCLILDLKWLVWLGSCLALRSSENPFFDLRLWERDDVCLGYAIPDCFQTQRWGTAIVHTYICCTTYMFSPALINYLSIDFPFSYNLLTEVSSLDYIAATRLERRLLRLVKGMARNEIDKPKRTKKPFYLKKSDLDLEDYKKEIQDQSPRHLLKTLVERLRTSKKFHIWCLLQIIAALLGFGQVMACIGILWMFHSNTQERKAGEKSAYSLFNKNIEAIDGATNMEYLDREIRRQLY
ncbi:hypothetical protein EDC01DRAFT_633424 [Geopyxis carbonaria]|nr:hypothetical protein EDC01DRAFT_633424 [Geopyxis carbonaria]